MTWSRRRLAPPVIAGLILLALGVAFLLDNFGYPAGRAALTYWPIILILIGVVKLVQARSVPAVVSGSIWVLVGTWILLNKLHLIDPTFADAMRRGWPLILVAIGFSIVWNALRGERGLMASAGDRPEFVDVTAIFGSVKRVGAAMNFIGADLTSVFGGVHLDLRRAMLQNAGVVDVFVLFGAVEITVPENWTVEVRSTPIIGGADDRTRPPADPNAPRLMVTGTVIFGGMEIKNRSVSWTRSTDPTTIATDYEFLA